MEGAAKDLETAEKWEMALTAAEWVEMLAEKAWSASASLAFGPVGAQVADEVYKCVMESIKAIGENGTRTGAPSPKRWLRLISESLSGRR